MADKKSSLSSLIRNAGRQAKSDHGKAAAETSSSQIFSVLEYIESSWGLNMRLFPVQRFIVKLYYNLELDDVLPVNPVRRIKITDMFKSKVLYEFTEKEYLRFLFNEGRCNIKEQDHDRRELVLPIGRRGGKCKVANSLVISSLGLLELGELGDLQGDEWQPLDVTIAQPGGKRAQTAYFYNNGLCATRKIRLSCGIEDESTPNHRIKVLGKDGVVRWKCMGDLEIGDYVAVNRGTDLWPTEQVQVPRADSWELPNSIDENFGLFLGYLVGDGTWGHKSYLELTGLEAQVRRFSEIAEKVLGHPGRCFPAKGSKNGWHWRFDGVSIGEQGPVRGVREVLDGLGFLVDIKRNEKRIPWSIRRSPKSVVCAFLRGLFETDGCAEDGGRRITLSSASFGLAREVQALLLNLGVVSKVKRKCSSKYERYYANLVIIGADSRAKFCDLVGFDSARKMTPLCDCVQRQLGRQDNKSDTESIPYQIEWLRELLDSIPKRNASAGKPGWGRSHLRVALGNSIKSGCGEDITYPRLRKALGVAEGLGVVDSKALSHLREILRQDYFYDPIVELSEGESQVYDLNVPEGQSFVANGFTNHNTTLSGIFASYEVYRLLNLYNPQEYYGLPNGNRIQIISVATDKDQAGLLFNEVTTHLAKCEYFKPFIANNTLSHVNFRTPYDIEKYGPTARQENGKFVSFNGKATLRVTFKSSIAKGLRGAGNIVIILDEAAHFQDKGGSSAEEIYNAVTPSAAAFSRKDQDTGLPAIDTDTGQEAPVESRIILISSPLGRSGKFFEKFDLAMRGGEGSENILAIQAPTWEVNPTVPASYYTEKYHADPTTFIVEHGAQFSDQARGWIERVEDLTACIDLELRPKERSLPKFPHQMGVDVGVVGDGTAIVITHAEEDKVILDYHEIWYAGVNWWKANPHLSEPMTDYAKTLDMVDRLDFDEIANWIEQICRRFYITKGLFDRWHGISLEQNLHKKGLKQFDSVFFTRDQTSKIYQTAKMFMFDERLSLYDYPIPESGEKSGGVKHSPLISELLTLEANQVSKNIVLVEAPKKVGAHDDLSDAFVRSVWLTIEAMLSQKHVRGGYGVSRPYVSATPDVRSYQRMRSRRHGSSPRPGGSIIRPR